MADGFDIGINFIEPDDKGNKPNIEPKPDKPKKTSSKGKSSTGPSVEKLTQEQLSRMKEIETKYAQGKAKGPEIAEYLKLAKVQIRGNLEELLSKGDSWVGGKEILRGAALQRMQDEKGRRGHPNEIKNRLKAQMTKAMDKAISNMLSQATSTQPSPDIVADVANKATEEVSSSIEQKVSNLIEEPAFKMPPNLENVYGFGFGTEDLPDPTTVSREEWLKEYMPLMMKGLPNTKIDHEDMVTLESMFGDKNPFSPDSPLMKMLSNWSYSSDLHEANWGEGVRELFADKSAATRMMLEQISKESGIELDEDIFYDPADNKSLAEAFAKYLPKYVADKPYSGVSNLLETSKAVLDPLEYSIKAWENARAEAAKKTTQPTPVVQEQTQAPSTPTVDIASKIPRSKKTTSNAPKDIFSYATEENAQQYEEQEAKRKQEQASKKKEAEDKARKMVEDAIMPVNESLKDIADSVSKIGTGAGSGDGGKGPKAPPGFDDDGMDDDGYTPGDYDPLPTLRARIENLQRTFKSTLYAEKESNVFSSLQKTFEKGRKAQDLDTVQKNVEEEVRAQMKLLLAFETRNENQRNLLEAALIEKIRKESSREEPNQQVINWLTDRLAEVKESRNKIQDEFAKIEADITRTLSERAMAGFAQGTIERDIRELENQAKEEDKIIDSYMKQFSKYVKTSYKEIAKEKGFEVARKFKEENIDKMSRSELLKKMQIAFDKEVARVMDSLPTETELTIEEIVAAHQAGQGEFAPETFKPKGALPEYTQRQPGASGGGSGTGGPGATTAAGGSEDIPPSRSNLSMLIPPPKVDMDKVRTNFARFALIQQATKPMVAASTPQGVSGSQVIGSGAAVGSGALALGMISGPLATVAVGVTQMTGILAEIAENTIKEVTPFSQELTMVKVSQSLDKLAINMNIANKNGSDLAIYQKSTNSLSNQLYELGSDIFNVADLQLSAIFDTLTIFVALVRIIVIFVVKLFELLEIVLWPIYLALRKIKEVLEFIAGLVDSVINGGKRVPDYTEDFMANDPRRQNNNKAL